MTRRTARRGSSLRQRQAFGQVALDNGFTFTGGQMWSLVTETKHRPQHLVGVGGEPHGLDGMIFTSFRYYLPWRVRASPPRLVLSFRGGEDFLPLVQILRLM
jgi:hypothetical protein